MSAPFGISIPGRLVLQGYEPDGDSVRFIADDVDRFRMLQRSYRIKPSQRDASVQLRFEGIDATELHYGKAAQPLAGEARNALLELLGFCDVQYGPSSTKVVSSNPETIRGGIIANAAEANGRPVAYVFREADLPRKTGWVQIDRKRLEKSLNFRLLESGLTYYTVYTSMAREHRHHFQRAAKRARKENLGVWAVDSTAEFTLADQSSIGPEGQCILPKLFRRCTDYLKDRNGRGFEGNLTDWLKWVSEMPSRNENDRVLVSDSFELSLSELLLQRNQRIAFQADPLDIVFVEK